MHVTRALQDQLDVVDKAHVEHLVCLVEHSKLQIVHHERFAFQVILHPARGTDDDVTSTSETHFLLAIRRTAVHAQRFEAVRVANPIEIRKHLLGELARRRQHDTHRSPSLHASTIRRHRRNLSHLLNDWKHKCQSLTATSARSTDDILTAQRNVERLRLNRKQRIVSLLTQRRLHRFTQLEIIQIHRVRRLWTLWRFRRHPIAHTRVFILVARRSFALLLFRLFFTLRASSKTNIPVSHRAQRIPSSRRTHRFFLPFLRLRRRRRLERLFLLFLLLLLL